MNVDGENEERRDVGDASEGAGEDIGFSRCDPRRANGTTYTLLRRLRMRAKAAEEFRPAFEQRLKELGYGPLAIAHTFSTLTGSCAVAEALAELARNARFERSSPVRSTLTSPSRSRACRSATRSRSSASAATVVVSASRTRFGRHSCR